MQLDPWVGKIPRGGNGDPLQGSGLENPMDRGAWWAAVHGVTESWKEKRHNLAAEQRQITLTTCLHMLSINSFFNCGKIYIT